MICAGAQIGAKRIASGASGCLRFKLAQFAATALSEHCSFEGQVQEIFQDVQTLGHFLSLRAVYMTELFTNVKELAVLNFKDADVAINAMRDQCERLQAVDAVIGTGKAEWTKLWLEAYQFASPCLARSVLVCSECCVWRFRCGGQVLFGLLSSPPLSEFCKSGFPRVTTAVGVVL